MGFFSAKTTLNQCFLFIDRREQDVVTAIILPYIWRYNMNNVPFLKKINKNVRKFLHIIARSGLIYKRTDEVQKNTIQKLIKLTWIVKMSAPLRDAKTWSLKTE